MITLQKTTIVRAKLRNTSPYNAHMSDSSEASIVIPLELNSDNVAEIVRLAGVLDYLGIIEMKPGYPMAVEKDDEIFKSYQGQTMYGNSGASGYIQGTCGTGPIGVSGVSGQDESWLYSYKPGDVSGASGFDSVSGISNYYGQGHSGTFALSGLSGVSGIANCNCYNCSNK